MHYAIVKCEKFQKIWSHSQSIILFNSGRWKERINKTLEELEIESGLTYRAILEDRIKRYEQHWESDVKTYPVLYTSTVKNGLHTVWKGEVNQERLRVGDHIFIPVEDSLKSNFLINKVEVHPDGNVIYHIDHKVTFTDNLENSRIQAIEDMMTKRYPDCDKFEDLEQFKDYIYPPKKEYEDYMEKTYSKKEEIQKAIKEISEMPATINPLEVDIRSSKPHGEVDVEDEQYEKNVLKVLVSGIFIFMFICMVIMGVFVQ